MLNVNLNEQAALQLVLQFMSVKELITFAMYALSEGETVKNKENATVCLNALEAFLK